MSENIEEIEKQINQIKVETEELNRQLSNANEDQGDVSKIMEPDMQLLSELDNEIDNNSM